MVPVLVAVTIGALLGALRRPLGAHLELPGVRRVGLLALGVAAQVLLAIGAPAPGLVLACSLGAFTVFAASNLHLAGFGVVTTGLALNTFAVLVHGAMPVRATAIVRAGITDATGLATVDLGAGRRFERVHDALPWLGDVLPIPTFHTVASFGDLVVWFGLAAVAGDLMRLARRGQAWSLSRSSASKAITTVLHDWGRAPSPSPVSALQYSAHPDDTAPDVVVVRTESAIDDATAGWPVESASRSDADLVAASHDR